MGFESLPKYTNTVFTEKNNPVHPYLCRIITKLGSIHHDGLWFAKFEKWTQKGHGMRKSKKKHAHQIPGKIRHFKGAPSQLSL